MRAVLDSNVLARAVYSVGGPAEELARRLVVSPHELIVSEFLLAELRRVLHAAVMECAQRHAFEILDDIELLRRLRQAESEG